MFRKTAFYCHLKQASAGMIETPMIEDSPFSASLSVGSDTTESNLSIITADKNQMTEDIICYSQNTYTSDNYTDQMNAAVNTSVRYTYQEEITSLQTDTAMTLYSSKYTPFNGINKEEDPVRVVSDHTDQAVEGTPVAAICKEECLQASTLVLLDNLDHAVESTHVVDIAEEGLSIQTDAHVPLGDIEKVSEGALVTEDTFLQTDTIMPLTIDMDIPTALTMNMDMSPLFFSFNTPVFFKKVGSSEFTSVEDNDCVFDASVQVNDIDQKKETKEESVVEDIAISPVVESFKHVRMHWFMLQTLTMLR
ncbi:hypothetical protein BDF21DRAFT_452164 [Thamnidium elegans]|nr:hypothetical protein BDF21DRAFT_452164 [Thamnidium elegans]